jgi:hypothetical protein
VATDVLGVSGRQMLEAMVAGVTDLAWGRLRRKRGALEQALDGLVGPHQRFLLREQLAHPDDLELASRQVCRTVG